MNGTSWLPVAVLLSSLVPGILIFFLPEGSRGSRTTLNLLGAGLKLGLVVILLLGVAAGGSYEARFPLLEGLDLHLHADPLSLLFVTLSALLWLVTTVYAIGYLEDSPNRGRFFGFFSLCVTATTGVALAGNLITFVIFYEMLTLTTYPLMVHRGTAEAIRAGRVYLAYTLSSGALLLLGVVWLRSLVGPIEFTQGGFLIDAASAHRGTFTGLFFLFLAGFGVKAALFPLHGWLPKAMVAPAPVSALLHAVAVVKAGAFGIVRLMYDVYGIEFCRDLGVNGPVVFLAAFTILYGSLLALRQQDLKKRLAYSTISQLSYIALGAALAGPLAAVGGFVHLVHQGTMKITLFFCAGNLAETLGIHSVKDLDGVGRRMPWTMGAFTLGCLGMIGVPPTAGFVTKWFLGTGAVAAHSPWVIGVLVGSTALNAAYFLPLIHAAWFRVPRGDWHDEGRSGPFETRPALLFPTLITAALALGFGLFAGMPFSPLDWAQFIVSGEYVR